jgi:hypothetical protein
MPIDAEKFIAQINGERRGGALPHEARAPDGHEAANVRASGADELIDKSLLGEKLEAVANKGLDKANEILDLPLDPERQHYPAELRARTALINTALTTQARIDETRMRPPRRDLLPEIIKLIKEEEEILRTEEEAHLRQVIVELREKRDGEPDGG